MMLRGVIFLLGLALPLRADVDAWDLAPLNYSDTAATDLLTRLAAKWEKDPATLPGATPLERLRSALSQLQVPEASQMLVFSKTSKQNGLIRPDNPRALYFSMDCYVGYVPGGAMEVAIQDGRLGPVFYHVDLGNPERAVRIERDTNECLSCHGTVNTESVPGLLVRSVAPDDEGHPLLGLGSGLVTHATPVSQRWGGYYVTGSISLPHLGNHTYSDAPRAEPRTYAWKNLQGKIDTTKYLRPTSDIVALMLLEHQCHAHNLLTAAGMNYNRAAYLAKAVEPAIDPDQGVAGRIADESAAKIIDWFLFTGEAEEGPDGVEGDEEFQKQFQAMIPHTAERDSLSDFQLNTRLFKNRCSYMIYSAAFRDLPVPVKKRVIAGLRSVFESPTADDKHPEIKLSERQRIARILQETGVW